MKNKIVRGALVVFWALGFSTPSFSSSKTYSFHSGGRGDCSLKDALQHCSIEIHDDGSLVAEGDDPLKTGRGDSLSPPARGNVSSTDPNRIHTAWWDGQVDGTLTYVDGVLRVISWDNGTIWGPDIECGNRGSTEERVQDCAPVPTSHRNFKEYSWDLVTRLKGSDGYFREVWKDTQTGLLWGDRLDSRLTHYEAASSVDGLVEHEIACISDEAALANGRISDRLFGLPSRHDFWEADLHGMRQVLPKAWWDHWTSTWPFFDRNAPSDSAFVYPSGLAWNRHINRVPVRCVGRPRSIARSSTLVRTHEKN